VENKITTLEELPVKFGRFTITPVMFASFRLDGGCMFGSVPKNLWSRSIPADESNRIPLVCRSLLIKDESRVILLDVGIGDKWSDKLRDVYAIAPEPQSSLGFTPDEITDVVLTHLHFDHAGGISYNDTSGTLRLRYPQAKVHLQMANWEHAQHPTPKDRASYMSENIDPLKEANLQLCDGSVEIFPDIIVHRVDGHTPGQQWIEILAGGERIFFPTDLIPTSHHVPLAYHMGYDVCADTLLREKLAFLERACQPGVRVCFQHDRDIAWATIELTSKGQFIAKPS
jgi:glyoxylase-like metal-dependent hydrolase (beta-lactamase superfamily II)